MDCSARKHYATRKAAQRELRESKRRNRYTSQCAVVIECNICRNGFCILYSNKIKEYERERQRRNMQ